MKKIILLLTFFIQLNSFAQEYLIKGINTGLEEGTMVLIRNVDTDITPTFDTTYVKNNKFEFRGKVKKCDLFYIRTVPFDKKQKNTFFVENTEIIIDSKDKGLSDAVITGGVVQNQGNELRALLSELEIRKAHLDKQRRIEQDDTKNRELHKESSKLYYKIRDEKFNFIKDHPNYDYCAYMLTKLKLNLKNEEVSILFSGLNENVQLSKWGKIIKNYLEKSVTFNIGDSAIDFTLKDSNNKDVKLSSFQGKYVLLDFWGSWCGSCRIEHPNLSKLYNEYKDKGFEILSVSLDKDKQRWETAMNKDNMTWSNVCDTTGFSGDIAVTYKIFTVPLNFLIDKEGKIIAKNIKGINLENKLNEILK